MGPVRVTNSFSSAPRNHPVIDKKSAAGSTLAAFFRRGHLLRRIAGPGAHGLFHHALSRRLT
jgi:hypothetical protein